MPDSTSLPNSHVDHAFFAWVESNRAHISPTDETAHAAFVAGAQWRSELRTEQPEDALSNRGRIGVNATLERPQNDSEIARHAARMCVCGHIRADHEQVEGGVGCRHIDCACGPGCIHEGFVDAEEGANYQDHPKQANSDAEITDAQAAVAFAALFYAEADYPKEIGKYENGFKSVKRALQRAIDHGPGNCGKETCFGCYRR